MQCMYNSKHYYYVYDDDDYGCLTYLLVIDRSVCISTRKYYGIHIHIANYNINKNKINQYLINFMT